jgi:hypothetical protein
MEKLVSASEFSCFLASLAVLHFMVAAKHA